MDLADQLQKLQALREQGGLSEDEFMLAKKRLLDVDTSRSCGEPAPSNTPQPSILHQLRLSTTDKWIGGVCGGLATTTGIPAWSLRIVFLLTVLLHGVGALAYLLLWIFVPIQPMTPPVLTKEKI